MVDFDKIYVDVLRMKISTHAFTAVASWEKSAYFQLYTLISDNDI
jgi:hypothetical protein